MSGSVSQRFSRELEVGERLAREAGDLALRFRKGELDVEMKPGDEPVTAADRAASDLIVKGLLEAFPDDVVISEENADNLDRLTTDRVWYIDPIDGTKDFIRGESGFSIMIGLAVAAAPTVGILYQPTADRMFLAARGDGSWFREGGELGRIHCSDIADPADIRLVASKSHRSQAIDEVKTSLGIADELNIGSVGLKLGVIALGERDLYVNTSGRTKKWDSCAPQVVLEEAGGRLTDLHGDPIRYDDRNTSNSRGLLASNGHVHDAVLAKLAPMFPREP